MNTTTHPRAIALLGVTRDEAVKLFGELPRCAADHHWRDYRKLGGEHVAALGNEPDRVTDYMRGKLDAARSLGGRVRVAGRDMDVPAADRDLLFEGRLVDFGMVWASVELDRLGSRSVLLGVVRPLVEGAND